MIDSARSRPRWFQQGWLRDKTIWMKIAISIALIGYYSLTLIQMSPGLDVPLLRRLKEPTQTFCEYMGWVQNWRLFGPEIRNINFHSFALIGYSDGTIGSWEPPRFELMTHSQKFCKDKFHKWDADCVPWWNYRDFWPGLARYIGKLHYDRTNVPAWFMLLRLEADIPDPRNGVVLDHDHMPPHSRLLNAFFYRYRTEDFK